MVKKLLILLFFVPSLVWAQEIKDVAGVPHRVHNAGNVTFVTQMNYSGPERIISVRGEPVIYRGNASYADIVSAGVVGYCSEYQVYYDSMTNKPSANIASEQDLLVRRFKSYGVWELWDWAYLLAQESNDDGEALINMVNPGTFDAECVNSGDVTFTSNEGFLTGGTNGYIRTNYTPSSDGVNYTQLTDDNYKNAALDIQYTSNATGSNLTSDGGEEVVDVNNGNQNITLSNVYGENMIQDVVEINDSKNVTLDNITGENLTGNVLIRCENYDSDPWPNQNFTFTNIQDNDDYTETGEVSNRTFTID